MRQYHDLLQRVPTEGVRKDDRNGTLAVFGRRMRLFQFFVANGRLSGQLCQRLADVFLGVRFVSGMATHVDEWLSRHVRAFPEQRAA